MALEPNSGSDHQLQNQMLDQLLQSPGSIFEDDSPSHIGVSALGTSVSISHLGASTSSQNTAAINIHVFKHPTDTGNGMSAEHSSLIITNNSNNSNNSSPSGCNGADSLPNSVRASVPSMGVHSYPPSAQQEIQVGQTYPQRCKRQAEPLPNPVPMSHQVTIPGNPAASVPPMVNFKKPRVEIKQGIPYSSHEPMLSRDPQLEVNMLNQQHFLRHQHMQAMLARNAQRPQMQPLPPRQLPGDPQNRHAVLTSVNGGLCLRRLLSMMHYQRHRPRGNDISFWRGFVEFFYAPNATQRWCLSQYDTVERHAGVFFQADMDIWKCQLCTAQSKKGFDANFEVLATLKKIYFDSGVIDELLHLEDPIETLLPKGYMMLQFGKASLKSVYNDFQVSHEGQLRVIFTRELKIISWEFCVKMHDEVISRRYLAAQVNKMIQDATRCQSNINATGADGVPTEDLLTSCNKLANAGNALASILELPLINDFGLPRDLFRSLQMYETLSIMGDLMCLSNSNKLGAVETLNRYQELNDKAKEQMYMSVMEGRAQMQQHLQGEIWSNFTNVSSSSNAGNNYQVPNMMFHTPNGREQTPYPGNYYQKLPIYPTLMQDPIQSAYRNAVSHSLPSDQTSDEDQLINGWLKDFHRAPESQRGMSANGKGKTRFVYDPNIATPESVHARSQTRDANAGFVLEGMAEMGQGSGSSARVFPDGNLIKREPGRGDNLPAHYQGGFFRNGHP